MTEAQATSLDHARRPTSGRSAPRRAPLVPLVVVAVWAMFVRVRIGGGVSVTPDGHRYLERAHAIAAGDLAFESIAFRPLHFPPLYPALLATLDAISPLDVARCALVLNLIAALALVLGLDRLLSAVFGEDAIPAGWRVLVPVAATWTAWMVAVGGAVLTDLMFFALWVWLTIHLIDHVRTGSRRSLVLATTVGAAAVGLRYAAGFLVAGAAVVLVLAALGNRRLRRAPVVLLAGSFAPTAIWAWWAGGRTAGDPTAHGRIGTLDGWEAATDSTVAFGSHLLGLPQRRVGDFRGRSAFNLPHLGDLAPALSTAVALLFAVVLVRALWRRRTLLWTGLGAWEPGAPGYPTAPTDSEGTPTPWGGAAGAFVIAIPTLIYLGLLHVYRSYAGFFVIQRYVGIAPILLWIALAGAVPDDPTSEARSRSLRLLTVTLVAATLISWWGVTLVLRL